MSKKIGSSVDLDQLLCFALYSTSLATTKAYRPLLRKWGLTYPQLLVLFVLWKEDGIMVSSLGENLFLDSGTLTPLLKRMEAMKLVIRRRSSEDERQVIVSLAAKGQALKAELGNLSESVHKASRCSASELKALTQTLRKVRTSLLKFQDQMSASD